MLLTITYTGENATNLGFLLHKNPNRPQEFELNHGKAYVFYPVATSTECTAALLLDINPIDLTRGKEGSHVTGLFDYVNDRPYVSSSFMSTAISRVYGTALGGRCAKLPDLVQQELELSATITNLPCRGELELIDRIFIPLGYEVFYQKEVLDEKFPQWGESPYVNLTLKGKVTLQRLLQHLYLLIPVFDRQKHYWMGTGEVEKLLRHGEGWLEDHPEKDLIIHRYFPRNRSMANRAIRMISEEDPSEEQEESRPTGEDHSNLNTLRMDAVVKALLDTGATSVIDMGCGEGNLLKRLVQEPQFKKIAGMDVSLTALNRAQRQLHYDRMTEAEQQRLQFFQSSLIYQDDRFAEYDVAAVIEVVEHLDLNRLTAFREVLFGVAKPQFVVLTTPNREYNINYSGLAGGSLRHGDHRFEWTRSEFQVWCEQVSKEYGYEVTLQGIGDVDPEHGTPTQMGVFRKCS